MNFKHGHASHGKITPEYHSWYNMITRCTNPNVDNYPDYGGRGITVCDRWLGDRGFENFLSDLDERPKGTTLGRFGDEGNYEPKNTAWQTDKEQRVEKKKKRLRSLVEARIITESEAKFLLAEYASRNNVFAPLTKAA